MKKLYIILLVLVIIGFIILIILDSINKSNQCKYDYVYVRYGFKGIRHCSHVNSLEELSNLYDQHPEYTYIVFGKYSDKSCNYWNNTPCGKTIFCPTHGTKEQCLLNGGSWELESPLDDYNSGVIKK